MSALVVCIQSCGSCFYMPNFKFPVLTISSAFHSLRPTEAAATLLADNGCSAIIEGANSPCTKTVSFMVDGVDCADGPQCREVLVLQGGVLQEAVYGRQRKEGD